MVRLWGESVQKLHDFLLLTVLLLIPHFSIGIKPNQPRVRDTARCGQNLYNATGQITSPGFPNGYKPLVSCEWYVRAPTKDWFIEIYFKKFRTDEKTSKSKGDILRIYDRYVSGERDQPKWSFSGVVRPRTILVRSNSAWLLFDTDHSVSSTGKGFQLEYKFIQIHVCKDPGHPKWGYRTGNDYRIGATVSYGCEAGYALDGASRVKCVAAADGSDQPRWNNPTPSCSTPCSSSTAGTILLSRHSDVILSQNYPNNYSSNHSCTWVIHMNETYLNINLTTDDFRLSSGDFFEFYRDRNDGQPFASFSEEKQFAGIISRTNKLIVKFVSGPGSGGGLFKLSYSVYSNSSNVCLQPVEAVNMYVDAAKSYFDSGDFVQYRCRRGYVLARKNSENTFSTCLGENQWSVGVPRLPSCVSHCKRWSIRLNTYEDVILTNQTGVILSPAYPRKMPKGTKCSYTVRVNPGQIIEMWFDVVSINNFTTITIYDIVKEVETVLASLTEISSYEKILSSSNSVRVSVQKSGGQEQGKFILKYSAVTSEFCKKPHIEWGSVVIGNNSIGSFAQIRCDSYFRLFGPRSSICTTDGLTNRWHPPLPRCVGRCGGAYSHPKGTIVSPDYPGVYHDLDPCFWNVRLEKGIYSVNVNVVQLHQPPGTSLELLSGAYEKQLHGECNIGKACLNITFDMDVDSSFQIRLKPGFNAEGIIFKLSYVATLKYRPPEFCPPIETRGGVLEIDNELRSAGTDVKIDCRQPFDLVGNKIIRCVKNKLGTLEWNPPPPVCEARCLSTGVERFNPGQIASPGYPNSLTPGSQRCVWRIRATPGFVVALSFRYIDIPRTGGDNFVEIYDVFGGKDKLLGRVVNSLRNFTSISSIIKINVSLNVKPSGVHRGFLIDFNFIKRPRTTTPKPLTLPPTSTPVQQSTHFSQISTSSTANDRVTPLQKVQVEPHHNRPNIPMILGVLIGTILVVIIAIVIAYIWYRKRYPVRLVVGRKIEKQYNPRYDRPLSTISNISTMALFSGPDGIIPGGGGATSSVDNRRNFGGLDNIAFQISVEDDAQTDESTHSQLFQVWADNCESRDEMTANENRCSDQVDVNDNDPSEICCEKCTDEINDDQRAIAADQLPPIPESDEIESVSSARTNSRSQSQQCSPVHSTSPQLRQTVVPTITLTAPNDNQYQDIFEAQV